MGRQICIAALAFTVLLTAAPAQAAPSLVTLERGPTLDAFERRFQRDEREVLDPDSWGYLSRSIKGAIQVLENTHSFKATHGYSQVLQGFVADLSEEQIEGLRFEPLVESISVSVDMTSADQRVPWGIARIGAAPRRVEFGEALPADIGGVTVYVLDSGIDALGGDLNLVRHVNFADGPNADCHGHGTHVAGTIGARNNDLGISGVAAGVPLVGVRVIDCSGNGTSASIIKGIDWVAGNQTGPSVINLSVGGGVSPSLDAAVKAASAQGIFFAIAAGNAATDACLLSPSLNGSSSGIVTVAAVDVNESEAAFSNFGGCVDLWAPGVGVISAVPGVAGDLKRLSGTSMAAPHAAGAAALFLSQNPRASPAAVESALIGMSVIPGTASKDGRTILRLQIIGS